MAQTPWTRGSSGRQLGPVQTPGHLREEGHSDSGTGAADPAQSHAPRFTHSVGVPLADFLAFVIHMVPAALPGDIGGRVLFRAQEDKTATCHPCPQSLMEGGVQVHTSNSPSPAHTNPSPDTVRPGLTVEQSLCPHLCGRAVKPHAREEQESGVVLVLLGPALCPQLDMWGAKPIPGRCTLKMSYLGSQPESPRSSACSPRCSQAGGHPGPAQAAPVS